MAESLFYIWASDDGHHDDALWWGPNGSGYTYNLDRAGLYTEAQARKHNLGDKHILVPQTATATISHRAVSAHHLKALFPIESDKEAR